MGQKIASLEIELGMATGTAVAELSRFGGAVDAVSAQAIRDLDRIDASMKNVGGLDAATASAVRFAEETAKTALQVARDAERSERNGERLVAQMERQIAIYGLTKAEVRALRAEEAARAAELNNQGELAGRIRAREADLYAMELAAARKVQQAADAAAEDAVIAADKAARAKEREAQAVREAALAYNMFEAAARQNMAVYREEQAAIEAAERRRAARGPAMFEAYATQKRGEVRDAESAQAAADAERAAAALRSEASAAEVAAREHAALAAAVRGSNAAQVADAEAAERLRMSTDPLYAATKRLNTEIAESTRLYHAGATAPAEYARQQDVLAGRLRAVGQSHEDADKMMRRGGGTLTQLSFQLNDVATMAAMGAPPMQIFASQAGQIFQVAQMAEGGVKGFASEIAGLVMRFTPLIAVAAVAGAALYQWKESVEKDAGMKAYVQTLGLTEKEMKKLGDQSVTTGDMLKGFWKAINEGTGDGPSLMSRLFTDADKQTLQNLMDFTLNVFKGIAAAAYGLVVGSYRAVIAVWNQFPAALGDIFVQGVNGAASAIEFLINKGIDAVNAIARAGNAVIGKDLFGQVDHVQIERMKNDYAGAAAKLGTDVGKAFNGAVDEALHGMDRIGRDSGKYAAEFARERARKKAEEIVGDRTPKVDRHAEQLAREAAAVEAQIRNLYALAEAYGVSGAAALIAEARVKAESKAIKSRADIDAAVAREIRLAIAQRVSDGAKATAGMNEQAEVQERINGMVAAGLVPAAEAARIVQDQLALLPLLIAQKAAVIAKDQIGYDNATRGITAMTQAQERLNKAKQQAQYDTSMSAGVDQLAQLRLEGQLIGANDAARVHALATLKATQEAAKFTALSLEAQQAYIRGQVEIADQGEINRQRQNDYNDALTETADRWDIIASKVQSAGQGMADAFGEAGRAIGDLASIYASYHASRERAEVEHAARVKNLAAGSTALARENEMFALRSSGAQIAAYGDMASAAKGFFKEGSNGYKAIAAAEKVYRVAQLAMSLQAMIQNALETTAHVTAAGARATADGTAGIAAQSKLPFPANIAAMAATGAALVAAGIAVFGGFGGGKNTLPESNTGKGTVLGDADAQSESIRRGIDALHDVDTLMLSASRDMANHLRSIDNQIGGFAAQIARAGNVDANAGVAEGFKTDAVGSILKAVPLFGNALASLFGTKTTVVGSGLYGGAQSVGDIMAGGFDAQTYSDVQKKKKLFGITTSTKYSTQYGDADDGLENQFTLILRGFASAIGAAAGPLGEATGAVENRLAGFVVNIGKIDLHGLTGTEIQEKLETVFGAAADGMAEAAFPGIARFQKAGEGAFETLVRVSSTLEAVSSSLDLLGASARGMSIDAKLGLADQFDNVSDLTSAVDAYFSAYYTDAEQAAAKTAQMGRVFDSLGLTMPATLTGFRQLVEAQNLTTAAGQSTYSTLLQLAPAFADLQTAMGGAKSAADVAAERQDLERKLLELGGDTAAIRALDLAKLDASNRALQEQVWAVQDAKDAASAAEELRKAWSSVGDSIMDEVKRIRGLTDGQGPAGFAGLMGQFNAVTAAARAGDMDAAKQLPGLSKSLLDAAAKAATSRQELDRVQAEAAASLEATYAAIGSYGAEDSVADTATRTADAMAQAASAATSAASSTASLAAELRKVSEELAAFRAESRDGHARTANEAGRSGKVLERSVGATGGIALATRAA